jgi:hypothetical protein
VGFPEVEGGRGLKSWFAALRDADPRYCVVMPIHAQGTWYGSVTQAARLMPVVPERLAQWRIGLRPRINRITRRRLIEALARTKRCVPLGVSSGE